MGCSANFIMGIPASCEGSRGGIVTAYIWPYKEGAFLTTTDSGSSIEDTVSGISGVTEVHVINFRKNSGSFTSTLNIDDANGVMAVETEINLVFSRMESAKRLALQAMVLSDAQVVVKDGNGEYWAFGRTEPVRPSTAQGQTGTNATDGNNYTVTLSDSDSQFPLPLTKDAVEALLALVPQSEGGNKA